MLELWRNGQTRDQRQWKACWWKRGIMWMCEKGYTGHTAPSVVCFFKLLPAVGITFSVRISEAHLYQILDFKGMLMTMTAIRLLGLVQGEHEPFLVEMLKTTV